ncbi:MAG: hypothetical protein IPP74_14610 [Alphaproteobacteria bacterium]|nr:hypothetical protein [Alphaproteobacteria bacterium]
MSLTPEDKKDVKGAMGKAIANKVSRVTKDKPTAASLKLGRGHVNVKEVQGKIASVTSKYGDAKNKAIHAKMGKMSVKSHDPEKDSARFSSTKSTKNGVTRFGGKAHF